MTKSLQKIDNMGRALAEATLPEETMHLESMGKAGIAYAKEEGAYDELIKIWKFYIRAYRKTTELIEPEIRNPALGRPNMRNDSVTLLSDYGFTRMQWSRRKKIFEIADERIQDYIHDCINQEAPKEPTISGLMKFATQIIESSTGNEWWTPEKYINSVRAVMGDIDLDPATCEEANAVIKANAIHTITDDGIQQSWFGRVFLNPPYSRNKDFAEKMLYEFEKGDVDQAIVLLGAHAIETKWFAEYWNYVLCFTGHRITFDTPTGEAKAGNIAGSVFIYLGDHQSKFAEEFNQHGFVVKRWPQ